MLDFTKRNFRGCVEFFLWLNLILSLILGYWIGDKMGMTDSYSILAIVGAIVGLALGILENVLIGGFIAIILKIDENLEIIKNNSIK